MLFSIHDMEQGFQLWWWLQIYIEFSIACCNKIQTKLSNITEVALLDDSTSLGTAS